MNEPWEVQHNGHFAWYQRALLIGDFAPGLTPRADFIVWSDGRSANPDGAPQCETCAMIPDVDKLIAVEIATGDSHFLAPFRAGLQKWPKPTDVSNCWWCNTTGAGATTSPPLCEQCQEYLAGRKV